MAYQSSKTGLQVDASLDKASTAVQPGDLADVATSGAYADLSGTPTLGTAAAQDVGAFATGAEGDLAVTAVQPGDLETVATTGAYSDLSGAPTLGTAAAQDVGAFATGAEGDLAVTALQPTDIASGTITPKTGDLDFNNLGGGEQLTTDELAAVNGAASPSALNVFATMSDVGAAGGGTVTSVAVSGSDGIEVDSGSPVTTTGTIALGINASTLLSHLGVESGATADQTAQEIATSIDADATAETTLKSALGLGSAAYTVSTAYETAGAVSTHESTYAHGDIATALQPDGLQSAGNHELVALGDVTDISFTADGAVRTANLTGDGDLTITLPTGKVAMGVIYLTGDGVSTLSVAGTPEWLDQSAVILSPQAGERYEIIYRATPAVLMLSARAFG